MKIKSLTKNLSLCYHSYKVTEIFFIIDEFDKNFEKIVSDHSLVQNTDLKQRKDVDWLYTATVSNSTLSDTKIEVLAYDVLEHETQKHIIL